MPGSEAVSDTGPLISFEKLPGGFSLVKQLFSKLYIPTEVLVELEAGHAGADYLADHGLDGFVEVVPASSNAWGEPHFERLDAGERAAIGLAIEKRLPLLIEERLGRRLATDEGVVVIGAAGLVQEAYRRNFLSQVEARQAIEQLFAAGRIGKLLMEEMVARISSGQILSPARKKTT